MPRASSSSQFNVCGILVWFRKLQSTFAILSAQTFPDSLRAFEPILDFRSVTSSLSRMPCSWVFLTEASSCHSNPHPSIVFEVTNACSFIRSYPTSYSPRCDLNLKCMLILNLTRMNSFQLAGRELNLGESLFKYNTAFNWPVNKWLFSLAGVQSANFPSDTSFIFHYPGYREMLVTLKT